MPIKSVRKGYPWETINFREMLWSSRQWLPIICCFFVCGWTDLISGLLTNFGFIKFCSLPSQSDKVGAHQRVKTSWLRQPRTSSSMEYHVYSVWSSVNGSSLYLQNSVGSISNRILHAWFCVSVINQHYVNKMRLRSMLALTRFLHFSPFHAHRCLWHYKLWS